MHAQKEAEVFKLDSIPRVVHIRSVKKKNLTLHMLKGGKRIGSIFVRACVLTMDQPQT